MPPKLILIRHAQALHNETKDYGIHDPDLTEKGQNQCLELRKSLMENDLVKQAGLIVVSPMRRTIQTALLSLDWLIEKGVPIEADADWQENSDKPCDTGSDVENLIKEFPSIDFSRVLNTAYPDKSSRPAVLSRGQRALRGLRNRPEEVVVVVSHSGFLRLSVTGCFYFNADYRVFEFGEEEKKQPVGEEGKKGGVLADEIQLVQDPSTKENGGGLGKSFTNQVVLGSDLPPDDSPDELPPPST